MFMIRYIKADPNTYLMQFKGGRLKREGRGQSFFYFSPTTSLVAVPVGSFEVPFMFQEVTRDYQDITIQGQFVYRIENARRLAELMNFTLQADGKTYRSDDPGKLPNRLVNLVQVNLRTLIQEMDLRSALGATDAIVRQMKEDLAASEVLAALGVAIMDLTIQAIKPTPETARALEAAVREKLLQEADEAIYVRRNAAVEQERAIKENELRTDIAVEQKKREIEETRLEASRALQEKDRVIQQERLAGEIELEEKRQTLVDLAANNARKEADARAYGISATMDALSRVDSRILEAITSSGMEPEQMIAQAFRGLAQGAEKLGELNISPDLLRSLIGETRRD